ncbi:MAG: CapA family protein, partial [Anaerolineales bacterium]|nr:CapA family protein [Anaerolineales bacterium]
INDFHLMADAGAVLVSGSQAHSPQMMEFYNGAFLHYGLGNLFYDQMVYPLGNGTYTDRTRDEFIDRHVFYDGRYLGVEVLTAILMDYSRPQWMTDEQRRAFLSEYFYASGWIPLLPTPIPAPTVTLTPLALPQLLNATPIP